MKPYQKKKEDQVEIAKERIKELFRQAEARFDEDPKLSNRYVELARKIAMRLKVKIPPALKRRFCKHCGAYFVPGSTLKVRLQQGKQGKVVYHCLVCKKIMRFPYKPARAGKVHRS